MCVLCSASVLVSDAPADSLSEDGADEGERVTQLQVEAVGEEWAAECPRRLEVVRVSKEFPFVVASLSKVEDFPVSDFAFLEEDLIGKMRDLLIADVRSEAVEDELTDAEVEEMCEVVGEEWRRMGEDRGQLDYGVEDGEPSAKQTRDRRRLFSLSSTVISLLSLEAQERSHLLAMLDGRGRLEVRVCATRGSWLWRKERSDDAPCEGERSETSSECFILNTGRSMRLAKASEARQAPNTLFSTRGLAKACEPLRRAEKLNCWPVQLISTCMPILPYVT